MKRMRLTDEERGRRVRQQNRVRSEKVRERLETKGQASFTVWIPLELKTALVDLAGYWGKPIGPSTAEVLQAGLKMIGQAPVKVAEPPLSQEPLPGDRNSIKARLMEEVEALVTQGIGYGEIARRWNAEGRTTPDGAVFRSGDLARAHRRWKS